MRVCIVSPAPLVSNPRVVKEASALRNAGCGVEIIAGSALPEQESADAELRSDIGVETQILNFSRRPAWRADRLRQEAAKRLYSLTPNYYLAEIGHNARVQRLARAAQPVAADLYIAHYVAALPAAARAARRHGADYAFDAEDFHPGDLPDAPQHRLEKSIVCAIESRYLPGAAYVTAASSLIADAYVETYGIPRPTVVLNVFPRKNAPPAPTSRGDALPGPSLYWFSQTIGPGRGLETAIEAIARAASAPHLYLRGTPAAGYEKRLRALAQFGGVANRVHILASAAPAEMERLGARYDLGFVGELAETRNRKIAITNKLFSYLLGGIPSLATDVPAHRALFPALDQAMTLFPIGDAAALAAGIDRLLLDPDRLSAARARAWRLGQDRYCWEVEERSLLRAVKGALAPHTSEA